MLSNQQLRCDVDLPPDERSLYYQVLRTEYHELKHQCLLYWKTKSSDSFDEDIFHDTLINSINSCCYMTCKDEIYKYIKRAYYINMIREQQYSRNLHVLRSSNNGSHQRYINPKGLRFEAIRREIYEFIKKDKGERIATIILDYIDGYTYKELSEKYDIKNIFKKAVPLKQYVKKLLINCIDM